MRSGGRTSNYRIFFIFYFFFGLRRLSSMHNKILVWLDLSFISHTRKWRERNWHCLNSHRCKDSLGLLTCLFSLNLKIASGMIVPLFCSSEKSSSFPKASVMVAFRSQLDHGGQTLGYTFSGHVCEKCFQVSLAFELVDWVSSLASQKEGLSSNYLSAWVQQKTGKGRIALCLSARTGTGVGSHFARTYSIIYADSGAFGLGQVFIWLSSSILKVFGLSLKLCH